MTEPLADVWVWRDYPVLKEAARLVDRGESAPVQQLVDATGLSEQEVTLAARALKRRGLITPDLRGGGLLVGIDAVSGDAYLLTGLHPNGADVVDRLVNALRQAAEETPDAEEKSRLRRAAGALGDVSKSVAAGVLTAVISGGIN